MVRGPEVDHLAPDPIGMLLLTPKRVAVEVIDDAKQLRGAIDAVIAARSGTVDTARAEEAADALEQWAIRLGESDREHEQQLFAAATEGEASGALREPGEIPRRDFFTGKRI